MRLDPFGLLDNSIALDQRLEAFNRALERYGARDPHLLSFDLKVTPQVVIAYYELNILDDDELEFLRSKTLDTGLISVLMNIDPEIRERVYKRLDDFLEDPHPVARIIEFVNAGAGRTTISEVYEKVEREFWGAVASYLKDTGITSGTVNTRFRSLLVNISKYDASERQLGWLERGILHDQEQGLGIFTAGTFAKKYPGAVECIQRFAEENIESLSGRE